MSLPELRSRAAQKWRIARERRQLARNGNGSREALWWKFWKPDKVLDPDLRAALLGERVAEAASLSCGYFRTRTAPSFYFRLEDCRRLTAALDENFPGRADQVHAEAEAVCAHRFRIFSHPEVTCGAEIPWRRDLLREKESGLDHWSQLACLDVDKVGDSKIVWELNRHQHFLTLGQAYLLTGDERFAEECLAQWEHWQRENPYLRGINWASSLEVAFRAWSWIWAFFLLLGSRALTGRRVAEMTRALACQADFIAANLSTYFSPNTHLLGEGFALFATGLVFPELRNAETWHEVGRTILLEQIQKQVREDGAHIEQSSHYHRYATDFFLCAAILADQNGCPFPTHYRDRLERMVEFIIHTAWPSGCQPMTGDADGGQVLALGPRTPNDHRATLSTAAVYFRRGDFRRQAGRLHEETLWLIGPQAAQQFAQLPPASPGDTSRAFLKAGLVAMRADWKERSPMLLFDAGPQGMGSCAHGHADALNILCSADGINWLVDPGTFVYTSSRQWRDFFRSTRAHNTVVVDGQDQAEPVDFFKWRKLLHVRLENWVSLSSLDFAVATHDGYMRLPKSVEHRRSIIFAKPDYWIVSDKLFGSGVHTFEFFFHFAPGVKLERSDDAWLASKSGREFLLAPTAQIEFRVATAEESPIQGWYSEDYGHREPTPVLVGTTRTPPPVRFHWLLGPVAGALLRIREFAGNETHLVVEAENWTDLIATKSEERRLPDGDFATDAELAFLRWEKSDTLARIVLVNGRSAENRGRVLICSDRMFNEFEAIRDRDALEIHARPKHAARLFAPGIARVRLNGRPTELRRDGDWIEWNGED